MLDSGRLEALVGEPSALAPLLAYLRNAGYSTENIAALVDDPDPSNLIVNTARCAFVYDDELAEHPAPLATLARLFLLGGRVESAAYAAAIDAPIRAMCERNALVRTTGDGVVAEIAVGELDGDYLVSDKLFENAGGAIEVHDDPSIVWPTAEWSLRLYRALRRDARWTSLLDVGCGTGCVSLAARRRYRTITGFDLNPRAVLYARLNAALCGATTARYEPGNCLEYAAPSRFDHVVFAAPAGPSAGAAGAMVSYGGRLGHELALQFLGQRAGELVAPGGCVQVWSIFAIHRAHGGVRALVESALPTGRFAVDLDEVRSGGLYVSREHLDTGKLPPGSHYARGNDADALVAWLRANDIIEVVSAVVTLRDQNPA